VPVEAQEHRKACKDKKDGDECEVHGVNKQKMKGKCASKYPVGVHICVKVKKGSKCNAERMDTVICDINSSVSPTPVPEARRRRRTPAPTPEMPRRRRSKPSSRRRRGRKSVKARVKALEQTVKNQQIMIDKINKHLHPKD